MFIHFLKWKRQIRKQVASKNQALLKEGHDFYGTKAYKIAHCSIVCGLCI